LSDYALIVSNEYDLSTTETHEQIIDRLLFRFTQDCHDQVIYTRCHQQL